MADRPKRTKITSTSKESEITLLVEGNGIGDDVEEIYGPIKFADTLIWELWVNDNDGSYATRFVQEVPNGPPIIHDTFQQLAVRLDREHDEIVKRLGEAEWTRAKEMAASQTNTAAQEAKAANERITNLVTLVVAAGGFAVGLLAMVYLVVYGGPVFVWVAAFVLGSVVASTCVYFYGKYVAMKVPNPPWQAKRPPSGPE